MQFLLFGSILVLVGTGAFAGTSLGADAPLDISTVTAVAISGESSAVVITTDPNKPYQASLERHRTGWFARWNSAWSFDDCSGSGRMWREGALLRIDVGDRAWFGGSECVYDIALNIRKASAVGIDQQALKARFQGDFSAVTVAAKAADVVISGSADTVALKGDAMRVSLSLGLKEGQEVSVDARMLDGDFDFRDAPALSYAVTARLSFVDATRKSSPGAKPSLTVTADLVHATIR